MLSYLKYPSSFSFTGSFLRGGIDYEYKTLKASADFIYNKGDYSENGDTGILRHGVEDRTLSFSLTNDFESTVALMLLININNRKTLSNLEPTATENSISDIKYGGSLEFLF